VTGDDQLATARWHRLVSDRVAEMKRLAPELGSLSGPFWEGRADRYAKSVSLGDSEGEPFLRRLRRVAQPSSTAIDVGAGTGRFALPLAMDVRQVTAVDPSEAMLTVLRREAEGLGLTNLDLVNASWEDAGVESADIAFSSFVLTLVPDAGAFVTKLEAAARRHVFLYLGAYCGDAVLDPLWRHFHGVPRSPGPSYLDAIAVLRELGIDPEVRVVEIVNRKRFATVGEAVEHYREWLLLADTPEIARELEGLLATWLLGRRGALRSPLPTQPAAILHWRPRARR